jgi:hypothetical protein
MNITKEKTIKNLFINKNIFFILIRFKNFNFNN